MHVCQIVLVQQANIIFSPSDDKGRGGTPIIL